MKMRIVFLVAVLVLVPVMASGAQERFSPTEPMEISRYLPQDIEVEVVLTWYDPALCHVSPINCTPPWYRLGTGLNMLTDCGDSVKERDCYGKVISCPIPMSKDLNSDPRGYKPYFTEVSLEGISAERLICADSGGAITFLRSSSEGIPRFKVDLLWNFAENGAPPWGGRKIVEGTVHLENRHMMDEWLLRRFGVKPILDVSLTDLPH